MGSYDIRTATLEEKRSPEYKYLSKFYWGTRHEGNVRVVDMKDTHLSNSILFLKNKGATLTEEG